MTTTLPTNNNNNTPVQPDGMYNFRDLSLFFSNIKPGLMYRSENYLFASDKGRKEFVENYNMRTIVDLRALSDEMYDAPTGVRKIMAIIMDELTPASQMNTNFPAFLRDFGPTLGQGKMYIWLCKQGINGMKTFFKAILDNSVRTMFPLAFHCATGKDRTGMVAMIFGLLTSARDEEICNDYFETQKYMEKDFPVDMTLEEFQKEFFKHAPAGRKPPLELMPVIKSSFEATYEIMAETIRLFREEYGNIDNYLINHVGLTGMEVQQLRHILCIRPNRRIHRIDGLENFRDLSFYFSNIKPDLLYRSENFDWASDLGKQQLIEEYNIKTVIDLRAETDPRDPLPSSAVKRMVMPMLDQKTPETKMPNNFLPLVEQYGEYEGTGRMYLHILKVGKEAIRDFFKVILKPENLPIVFHCATGKDRTGIISMLAGLLTNSYEEDIVADFHESKAFTEKEFPPTMSDEDIMARVTKHAPAGSKSGMKSFSVSTIRYSFLANRESMAATIRLFKETFKTVDNYLIDLLGFTTTEVGQLRQILSVRNFNREEIDGLHNFRDMAKNLSNFRPGIIFRSESVNWATKKGIETLVNKYKVKTIIDLRSANDDVERPEHLPDHVEKVLIPVMDGLTPESLMPNLFMPSVDNMGPIDGQSYVYMEMLRIGSKYIKRFFKEYVLDESKWPIVYHCATGKDRTGFIAMLFGMIAGSKDFEIIDDYGESNEFTSLRVTQWDTDEEFIEEFKRHAPPEGRAKVNDFKIETIKSLFLSVPEIMEATIVKFLKRYGNVETYLSEEVGLTTDEINDLKFLLRVNQQIDFDADNNDKNQIINAKL